MTESMLNYETLPPDPAGGLRTGTTIYLRILGILYCLCGMCVGLGLIMILAAVRPDTMPRNATPITTGVLLFFYLGTGITYLWSASRLRRGSLAATITALIISIINSLGCLTVFIFGLVVILTNTRRDTSVFVGTGIYLLVAAANVTAATLLISFLRAKSRTANSWPEHQSSIEAAP
jgi:hypothetical protein